jgi:hypothetical protein
MRRTGKRSVTLAIALAVVAYAPAAWGFHAGNVFDKPAGAGGGGGLFYAGAPQEHGWNCSACHTESEGRIRVALSADPPELLQSFRFEPKKTYALVATLEGEHAGAGPSNFNALVVAFVGPDGAPAGEISGYAADEFYNAGAATIASAGQRPGENRWSFTWTAPESGPATLHLAAVDGNGAGQTAGTLTDPWGDDVFVGELRFDGGRAAGGSHDPGAAFAGILVLLGLRSRGGRR